MPISMAAIRKARVALVADYEGDTIKFSYYPHEMTDAFFEEARRSADGSTRATVKQLLPLLAEWDITEDGVHPLPITEESLTLVGPIIRERISDAITQHAFPSEDERKNGRRRSSNGS